MKVDNIELSFSFQNRRRVRGEGNDFIAYVLETFHFGGKEDGVGGS